MNKFLAIASLAALAGCSSAPVYQPLPPVKVITETVQLEIYQPPLPQEIKMQDVDWFVLTNTPCKPATGKDRKLGYYTTEQFQYEEVVKEDGTTSRQVVRDSDGNRVALPQLTDGNGVIQVCGNLEQKIAEIEKQLGGDFVIMAITPKGYENMAYNLQEIKRYLNQQKEIVMYYREATGGNKQDEPEEWLEKNSQNQAEQIQDAQTSNQQPVTTEQPAPPVTSVFSLKSLIPNLGISLTPNL